MTVFQIVSHQPQVLGSIVRNTPYWVWYLLTGLLALGVASLYGVFNGVFVARLIRLWRLTRSSLSPAASISTPSLNN